MWPFKRTLSERYSKLVKLIKSIDSHFELTEDKDKSLRLHLPNYKGNQPMDFHIYLMEPFLFISFITEIEGEKISCLNNFPQDTDQQDMFNLAMSNNLNKIYQVLEDKYSEDGEEKKDDGKEETDENHNSVTSNNDSSGETWGLRDYYDFNESFKKHALTIMILRRGIEFRYFASKNDYTPKWSYNIDWEKIQSYNCPSGAEPLVWIMKHYDNREDFCWLLEVLDEQIAHLWVESMEEPEKLIEEIQKYVPQFKLKNNPQDVKVNLGWSWIDIHAILHFIDYCSCQQNKLLSTPEEVKPLQECTTIEDISRLYWSDYTKELHSQKENNKEVYLEDIVSDSIVVQSWSLLDFAKTHGKMKRIPSSSHINSETGEEELSAAYCIFVHPTNKDEQGKPVITAIVSFSSELGELTAKEIGEQKDDLIVVEYESGNYSLKRKEIEITENHSTEVTEEDLSKAQQNDCYFEKITKCSNSLLLSLENYNPNELDKKLLVAELTILSTAMVLDNTDEEISHQYDFAEKKILDYYLSIKEVNNYDDWIVSNTPGMYSNDIYTTEEAIPLAEFERDNGQIKFYRGQINAYPYDDSFWGEFINKNGQKQIIYVDQGFPFEYNTTDILNRKSDFGIVEEKETDYHGDDAVYCLKEIKKKHSMLPSYVKERFSFFRKTIEEILSNQNNDETQIFQLYNAVTNERLNFNVPYFGIDDLVFNDETVVNGKTGETYRYDATSLSNFSMCFGDCLTVFRQKIKSIVSNLNSVIANNQSVEANSIRTDATENDLNNGWTDEYGAEYSSDKKRLIYVPKEIIEYTVIEGTEEIGDFAFVNIEDYDHIMGDNLDIHDFERYTSELVSVFIPNSVVKIGKGVFDHCTKLTIINIPEGATEKFKQLLPDYEDIFVEGDISTVAHTEDLAEMWIDEDGVKYSKDKRKLLKAPSGLTKCIINPHTKIICDGAFFECANIERLHLPENITIIGKYAFYGCDSLTEINLPKAVLKIDEKAFDGCKNLKSLYIPKTQYDRFYWMLPSHYAKFKEPFANGVIDEKGVVYDNDYQILHFNTLPLDAYSVKFGVKVIGDFAFMPEKWKEDDGTLLRSLRLPNSIVFIGAGAFAFNKCLEYINIPEKAALSNDYNPFAGCFCLHNIKWDTHNAVKEGTLIFNRDKTVLIACLSWHYADNIQHCWTLSDFAYDHGKMNLTNPTTSINPEEGKELTMRLCSFTHPTLKDEQGNNIVVFVQFDPKLSMLTAQEIMDQKNDLLVVQRYSGIFVLCKREHIIIEQESIVYVQEGVECIASYAFYGNKHLKRISFPKSLKALGNDIFKGCMYLQEIQVPYGTLSEYKKRLPDYTNVITESGPYGDDLPF